MVICVMGYLVSTNAFYNGAASSGIRVAGGRFSQIALSAGFGKAIEKVEVVQTELANGKCLCGSDVAYLECCKPFHENAVADPSTLIRARYSAYASSNVDFIISTTSKLSSDYKAFIDTPIATANGLKRWSKSIKSNMLDAYKYVRMEIVSAVIDTDGVNAAVIWRHLAIRKVDNVMYPIEEKSTLNLADGVWSYIKGEVTRPDPELTTLMMNTWPAMVGLELKVDDETIAASATKTAAPAKRNMMDYEGSKKFKTRQSQVNTPTKKNAERSGSP